MSAEIDYNERELAFPCPCCGYLVFGEPPGSYDICPICSWKDDIAQLRFVEAPGGANHVSLVEAQKNYATFGASEKLAARLVKGPREGDQRDTTWRRFDPAVDAVERPPAGKHYLDSYYSIPYADDPQTYYYWRRR